MGGKDGLVGQGVSTQMLMPGLMYSDMHGAPLGADMVRSWHLLLLVSFLPLQCCKEVCGAL